MAKQKDSKENDNVVISGDLVERIINLCEGSALREEQKDERKENFWKPEKDFIKEQMLRVATEMRNENVTSPRYLELAKVYDKLGDIVHFTW